jgi:hypothetical protein
MPCLEVEVSSGEDVLSHKERDLYHAGAGVRPVAAAVIVVDSSVLIGFDDGDFASIQQVRPLKTLQS